MKTRLIRFINLKLVGLLIFSIILQKSTIACPVEDFLKHIGGLIFLVPITPSGKIVLARHTDQETPCLIRFSKCHATRPIDFAWHAVCQMINSFQCDKLKDFKVLRATSRTPLGQPAYIYYLMFFLDDEINLKTKVQKFFTTPIEMQLISSGRSFNSMSIEALILEQCFSPKIGLAITLEDRSWIVGNVAYNQRRQTIEISFSPPEQALDRLEISKRAEDGLKHISDTRIGDLAIKTHPDKRGPITLAFAELEVLNLITPPLRAVIPVKAQQIKEDHQEFPPTEHDSANDEEEYDDDQIPYHKLDPEERLRITRERLLEKLQERRAEEKPKLTCADPEKLHRQAIIAERAYLELIEEEFAKQFKELFTKNRSLLKVLKTKPCRTEEEVSQIILSTQNLSIKLEQECKSLLEKARETSEKFKKTRLDSFCQLKDQFNKFLDELAIKKLAAEEDFRAEEKNVKTKPATAPLRKATPAPAPKVPKKPTPKVAKTPSTRGSSVQTSPGLSPTPTPQPAAKQELLILPSARPKVPVCASPSEGCPRAASPTQTQIPVEVILAGPGTSPKALKSSAEQPKRIVLSRPDSTISVRAPSPECLRPEEDPIFKGELPRIHGPIASPSRQSHGS